MTANKPLRIGVIGPAGYGGSHVCVELVDRGHYVVGLSRNPEKLGSHARYEPRPVNIEEGTENELAKALADIDVLICEYGPHKGAQGAQQYMTFVESIRKIILAVKRAGVDYFIMVGGTGSLHVPYENTTVVDSKDFFLAYRRGLADSHAYVSYIEQRVGPMGSSLRAYRNARLVFNDAGGSTEEERAAARATIEEFESPAKKEPALDFIKAARATYMFFDGNTSFNWTFVSPSALYRPGKRTGNYKVTIDDLPLEGEPKSENPLDGRLMGITAADLAIAIADEAEARKYQHKHWTATGDLSDDTPAPPFLTLE